MTKYVPAIQEEYIQASKETQAIVEYFLTKEPTRTLSFSTKEINDAMAELGTTNLRRTYSEDFSTITFSLVESDFDTIREGLLWVQVPEIEDLVPHG